MATVSEKLSKDFYARDAEKVARDLLGKLLIRDKRGSKTTGKIVETEAYLGKDDPASHTFGGKKTERTEIIYGPPGHAYVYLIYGMYHCFNVVTGKDGTPEGVFIRALEPVDDLDIMRKRRGLDSEDKGNLTDGPGKLCMAMDIDKSLNGEDLTGEKLFISERKSAKDFEITEAKRINIDYAGDAKNWKLRYLIKDNPFVSEKPD